jgi:hypothetical protein
MGTSSGCDPSYPPLEVPSGEGKTAPTALHAMAPLASGTALEEKTPLGIFSVTIQLA